MKNDESSNASAITGMAAHIATCAMGLLRWIDQRSMWVLIALGVIDVSLDKFGAPPSVLNGFYVLSIAIVLPLIWMQLSRFARFLSRRNA